MAAGCAPVSWKDGRDIVLLVDMCWSTCGPPDWGGGLGLKHVGKWGAGLTCRTLQQRHRGRTQGQGARGWALRGEKSKTSGLQARGSSTAIRSTTGQAA